MSSIVTTEYSCAQPPFQGDIYQGMSAHGRPGRRRTALAQYGTTRLGWIGRGNEKLLDMGATGRLTLRVRSAFASLITPDCGRGVEAVKSMTMNGPQRRFSLSGRTSAICPRSCLTFDL